MLPVLALATLLAACATVPPDAPRVIVRTVCPVIVEYDRPFMATAAEEYSRLSASSSIRRMIDDYVNTRDQFRACQSAGK